MGLTIKNVTEDELMVEEASNKAHDTQGYEQNRTRTAIHWAAAGQWTFWQLLI